MPSESPIPGPEEPFKPLDLEEKENRLWRVTLWFLTLLAVGLAATSWERLKELPQTLEGIPAGMLVLGTLFAFYAWQKRQELSDLRRFLRTLHERSSAPPTEAQLHKLFELTARSQLGYRELIDSFDDIIFSAALDGRILACNRRCADILGVPVQEMIRHSLTDLVEGPVWTDVQRAVPDFLERRRWEGVVKIRTRLGGRTYYFDTVLQAISDGERVTGVSGLARDVTRQRELEAFYTELFARLEEGIYLCTSDGSFLDVNPAMIRMLGYTGKEELLAVNWRDLQAPEAPGPLRDKEIALVRKDGTVGVFLHSVAIDSGPQGARYQGTLTDVTREREMENHLAQQREFVQRVVDSFPDLIAAFDTQGRYTFVSPRLRDLTGSMPEAVLNKPFGERILSDDLPAVRQLFDDLVAGRQAFGTAEFRVHHINGSVRTVRANATPIHEPSGKVSGVVVSARDMTEFKKLEQQVWQAEKLAAMGQMIAGVAHELNNPLTVILGASDLSATRAPDEATRHNFELIQQQAWRTARIVQDLLAFSRPPKPERSRLDMNDMIQRTLKLQEYSLRQAHIRTDFLPATTPPKVFGDDQQIMQVLLNLITNAEQAMTGTRQGGTLRIRTGSQNSHIWVTVEDDGPGLAADIAPHIFDPFFTTKRPGKNTGLGLSISLSLVREHGGTLTGQNAPAGGALFTLTLPAAPAEPAAEPAPAAGVDLRSHSVLVVDDETGILDLVRLALTRRGMQVECASNGKEALDKLQQGAYDCVLCDLKMPGITGRDVYQGYRQQHPNAAKVFIVMSGELMQQETQEFIKETQVPLLQKPFTLAELGEVLGRELHKAIPKSA